MKNLKELRKKFISIAMVGAIVFTITPITALANDTKDTFTDIPIIVGNENGGGEKGKASIKLDSWKYSSIDKGDGIEYELFGFVGSKIEDLGPGAGHDGFTIDEGYDLVQTFDLRINEVTSESFVSSSVHGATLTIPVPDGCSAIGAKRIMNWGKIAAAGEISENNYKRVDVTDNLDGTVSFPITVGILAWPVKYSVFGAYAVEFKKTVDISTLKSTATLSATTFAYTGSAITPDVMIPGLTKDTDYTVSYANNTASGTATVTVTGKGLYTGSFTLEFTIKKAYKNEVVKDTKTGNQFKVNTTSTGEAEAIYTGSTNKKAKKVTIPNEVTLGDGTVAKVTDIKDKAFKKNKKITTVTVGNNVETIGKSSFQDCEKLKKVTIGEGVTTIEKNAFKGCENLKTIIIKSKNITSIQAGAFKNINKNATIKVPKEMLKKYEKMIYKAGAPKSVKVKKL